MSDDQSEEEQTQDDVSLGKGSDPSELIGKVFSEPLRDKFEIFSYRNAAAILAQGFPDHLADILSALQDFEISEDMIRSPGGSKGPIAKYVDTLFKEGDGW
ncbi:MAG: restriction endonuclease, partial [Pseudomonadota bacterium]